MMNDAIKDKGEEKEEDDWKNGKGTGEGRRNQRLDQAKGGEESDGKTAGLNKRRKGRW